MRIFRTRSRKKTRIHPAALRRTVTALGVTAALTAGATAAVAAPASAGPGCTPAWTVFDTPLVPGGPYGGDVDALSGTDVRLTMVSSLGQPSVARWDGRSIAPAAAQPPGMPKLPQTMSKASYDSATHGWARINRTTGAPYENPIGTLLHFSGGRWTPTPVAQSPHPEVSNPTVADLASVSPSDGWAVGRFLTKDNDSAGAMIQRWDGSAWKLFGNPLEDQDGAALSGVTAVSATDVWAVGERTNADGVKVPMTLHFDGTSWAEVPVPRPEGGTHAALTSVSASGGEVWAGGQYRVDDIPQVPLVLRWDGTAWKNVPIERREFGGFVGNVYAAAPGDVWLNVIYAGAGNLLLHGDGSTWTEARPQGAQPPTATHAWLGIDGTGPQDVWAVGLHAPMPGQNVPIRPLIAHLSCGGK